MKKFVLILSTLVFLVSCSSTSEQNNDLHLKVRALEDQVTQLESDLALASIEDEEILSVYKSHYHYMEVVDDKIYVIYENDDDNVMRSLWSFTPTKKPEKLFEGKELDFRVSPNGKYIAIRSLEDVYILDGQGQIEIKLTKGELGLEAIYSMELYKWNDQETSLWIESKDLMTTVSYIKLETNTWEHKTYENDFVFTDDYSLNPNTGWILFSDYPIMLDTIAVDEFYLNETLVTLYLYELESGDKFVVDSYMTNEFKPKWTSDDAFYYTKGHRTSDGTIIETLMLNSLFNSIYHKWQETFNNISLEDEGLSDVHIDRLNELFEPTLSFGGIQSVNPIACFFTSYYEKVNDLNLADFLRYFPYGEVPKELEEFDDLKAFDDWPFKHIQSLADMPVPIHRYQKVHVEEVMKTIAGLEIDELSRSEEDVFYLEERDAFYNYTSDFAPGWFQCTSGRLVEDKIILEGKSIGSNARLTIVKKDDMFYIESFIEID